METPSTGAWDRLSFVPAVASVGVLVGYVRIVHGQGNEPALWFVAGLAVAAAASLYGGWRQAPMRCVALGGAGAVLVVCGLLALLSVGLPLVFAGGIALFAANRVDR